jgi:RNA polymerase sigma factor (sigma-70 family)
VPHTQEKQHTAEELFQELTHRRVERLIYNTVAKFWRRYGGDYEELTSRANLAYLEAFRTFDPGVAKFTTWVTTTVWWYLRNEMRREGCRKNQLSTLHGEVEAPVSEQERIDWREFNDSLKPDARRVVSLVLDSPHRLVGKIKARGRPNKVNTRAAVREYLAEEGWGKYRIKKAFLEVRRKLS